MALDVIILGAIILLGVIFLLIEIFLLPGVSIAGVAGVLFILGGIVYAYFYIGATAGNITLLSSGIILAGGFLWLVKSKALRKIALNTEISESVDNSELKKIQPGDVGITLSRLNPIGKILINDVYVEAKTLNGELLDEDVPVKVVKVESYQVIVTENN